MVEVVRPSPLGGEQPFIDAPKPPDDPNVTVNPELAAYRAAQAAKYHWLGPAVKRWIKDTSEIDGIPVDPEYEPFKDPRVADNDELKKEYGSLFATAQSYSHMTKLLQRIERDKYQASVIGESPIAGFAGLMLDPTVLLASGVPVAGPVGTGLKYGVASGAASFGANVIQRFAVPGGVHSQNDLLESTILSAGIGGVIGYGANFIDRIKMGQAALRNSDAMPEGASFSLSGGKNLADEPIITPPPPSSGGLGGVGRTADTPLSEAPFNERPISPPSGDAAKASLSPEGDSAPQAGMNDILKREAEEKAAQEKQRLEDLYRQNFGLLLDENRVALSSWRVTAENMIPPKLIDNWKKLFRDEPWAIDSNMFNKNSPAIIALNEHIGEFFAKMVDSSEVKVTLAGFMDTHGVREWSPNPKLREWQDLRARRTSPLGQYFPSVPAYATDPDLLKPHNGWFTVRNPGDNANATIGLIALRMFTPYGGESLTRAAVHELFHHMLGKGHFTRDEVINMVKAAVDHGWLDSGNIKRRYAAHAHPQSPEEIRILAEHGITLPAGTNLYMVEEAIVDAAGVFAAKKLGKLIPPEIEKDLIALQSQNLSFLQKAFDWLFDLALQVAHFIDPKNARKYAATRLERLQFRSGSISKPLLVSGDEYSIPSEMADLFTQALDGFRKSELKTDDAAYITKISSLAAGEAKINADFVEHSIKMMVDEIAQSNVETVARASADPLADMRFTRLGRFAKTSLSPAVQAITRTVSLMTADTINNLVDMSLTQGVHMAGNATTNGGTVERLAMQHFGRIIEPIGKTNDLYLDYRGVVAKEGLSGKLQSAKMSVMDAINGRPQGVLSPSEFREEVGKALHSGDTHSIPQVQEAAQTWRSVLEQYRHEANELGMWTLDLRKAQHKIQRGLDKIDARLAEREARITQLQTRIDEYKKAIKDKADEGQLLRERIANETDPAVLRTLKGEQQRIADDSFNLTKLVKGQSDEIDRIRETSEPIKKRRDGLKGEFDELDGEIKARESEMKAGSVPSNADSYFPVVWRHDAILNDREGLKQVLWPHFIKIKGNRGKPISDLMEQLDLVVEGMLSRRGGYPIDIDRKSGAASFFFDRTLSWVPVKEVFKYITTDVEQVMRYYAKTMGADIELTRKFGSIDLHEQIDAVKDFYKELINKTSDAKKQTAIREAMEADIDTIEGLRDRIRGTQGMASDPYSLTSRGIRIARMFAAVTQLGSAVLPAMVDVVRPFMTEGFGRTFGTAFAALQDNMAGVKIWGKEAQLAGTALDLFVAQRAAAFADISDTYGRVSNFERIMHNVTGAFFIANLLAPETAAVKSLTASIVGTRMLDDIIRWVDTGQIDDAAKLKLTKSGLDRSGQDLVKRIAEMYRAHGESIGDKAKIRVPNTEEWEDLAAVRAFRAALAADVDRIITTPGLGDKPFWATTELGSLFAQYHGFAMAAHQKLLLAGLQDRNMAVLGGFVALVGMGYMVDYLKSLNSGTPQSKDPAVRFVNALDRSGTMGWFFDANNVVENLSNNKIGARPLVSGRQTRVTTGRTIGTIAPAAVAPYNAVQAVGDLAQGDFSRFARDARYLLPMNNMLVLNRGLNELQR